MPGKNKQTKDQYAMQDPTAQYPQPEFPKQTQSEPATEWRPANRQHPDFWQANAAGSSRPAGRTGAGLRFFGQPGSELCHRRNHRCDRQRTLAIAVGCGRARLVITHTYS